METGPIAFLVLSNRTRTAGIPVRSNSPLTPSPEQPETRQARCGEVVSNSITLFGPEILEDGVQHLCVPEFTAFGSQLSFTALHWIATIQEGIVQGLHPSALDEAHRISTPHLAKVDEVANSTFGLMYPRPARSY